MAKHRNTIQLERIRDCLAGTKSHPTAEQVYGEVRKEIPSITLATVYRNLGKLEQSGQTIRLEVNGEFRFDADMRHHEHCVCRRCGRIIDMTDGVCEKAMKGFKSVGFKPDSVTVIFRGVCRRCSNK